MQMYYKTLQVSDKHFSHLHDLCHKVRITNDSDKNIKSQTAEREYTNQSLTHPAQQKANAIRQTTHQVYHRQIIRLSSELSPFSYHAILS